ncbi:hypothetical protein BE17_20020 [Sorangium cellulosum]|uniref:Uncharacterized protein n=1 Tax=Sorangium cellulosum TaxID=56 RepID=A0A150R4M3_SORCE|nr:hypothetical protein BE17_20020 [Sorangium cellulosum]
MANSVTYEARPDLAHIRMSNGLTSVFISVLSLAASALAETERERELAAWFASHDQGLFGLGVVGFDVSELPWSPSTFVREREFTLRVIEAAKARTGWERLGYAPREDWIQPCLDQLRAMIEALVVEDACRAGATAWSYGDRPEPLVLCPVHRVYQHEHGCVLCNDR